MEKSIKAIEDIEFNCNCKIFGMCEVDIYLMEI